MFCANALSSIEQSSAVVVWQAALTCELAMIQGPPGTGKSYVGIELVKILLANTSPETPAAPAARPEPRAPNVAAVPAPQQVPDPSEVPKPVTGPILIVCLTNHALDQFLESLHNADIKNIVRVGAGYVMHEHCLQVFQCKYPICLRKFTCPLLREVHAAWDNIDSLQHQ